MLCKKYCAGGTSYQSNFVPLSITAMNILHAFSHICHCHKSKIMAQFLSPSIVSTKLFAGYCKQVLCFIKIFWLIMSLWVRAYYLENVRIDLRDSEPVCGPSSASLNSHYHGWIYFNKIYHWMRPGLVMLILPRIGHHVRLWWERLRP